MTYPTDRAEAWSRQQRERLGMAKDPRFLQKRACQEWSKVFGEAMRIFNAKADPPLLFRATRIQVSDSEEASGFRLHRDTSLNGWVPYCLLAIPQYSGLVWFKGEVACPSDGRPLSFEGLGEARTIPLSYSISAQMLNGDPVFEAVRILFETFEAVQIDRTEA